MTQPPAKILEMFRSIQGEGKYVGALQVFVRFFECNMHCVWCDTPHSIGDTSRRYKEYDLKALLKEVNSLWQDCHSVSITGGEPLLQAEFLQSFLPRLKEEGKTVYLETNGVLPKELRQVIDHVDIIAMDIKLPSSTQCQAFWDEHEEFLRISLAKDVFIKTVISANTSDEDVAKAVEIVKRVNPDVLFILQPNSFDFDKAIVKKCIEHQSYCLKHLTDVRIMPQTHRFMKLR